MQDQWFYGNVTNRLGPVPKVELQRLAMAGQLGPMMLVWSEGMPQWVPAGSLPFLFPQGMPPMVAPPVDGGALNLLMPMGPQSGMSIAAGYLGLIGLVIWLLAPLAIIFGFLGMRDLGQHPEKRGKGRAITGIVCGILSVLMFIGVMAMAGGHHRY